MNDDRKRESLFGRCAGVGALAALPITMLIADRTRGSVFLTYMVSWVVVGGLAYLLLQE